MSKKESKNIVSIIIITYKEPFYFIEKCLESISKQTFKNFEVIVVDNTPSGDKSSNLKKRFPFIKTIINSKNNGFAAGINLGIKNSAGEFIAVFNPDIILDSKWLENMIKTAKDNPNAHFFTSKVLNYFQKDLIENAGYNMTVFGTHLACGYHEIDKKQYDKIRKVFYGTGCAVLFRRDLVKKIGLWDEKYFLYSEEVDFCWRCLSAGYDVLFVPSAVVYHHRQASTGQLDSSYVFYLSRRNTIRTLLKNQDVLMLFYALPMRIFIDFAMSAITAYTSKNFRYFPAFLKAILWNFANLTNTLNCRRKITKLKKRFNKELVQMGIMRYFFPGFLIFKK